MLADEGIATIRPVLTNSEIIPAKPRIMPWHWIAYYFYNWARKPKVWMKQRELTAITCNVMRDLHENVLPVILRSSITCSSCAESYMMLHPQIYLSQIELILKREKCPAHPELFYNFLITHLNEFRRSEEVACWINGFGTH